MMANFLGRFIGLVKTVAQFATDDQVGRHGWATDAPGGAGAFRFNDGTGVRYSARRDAAQTFTGLQAFPDGATVFGKNAVITSGLTIDRIPMASNGYTLADSPFAVTSVNTARVYKKNLMVDATGLASPASAVVIVDPGYQALFFLQRNVAGSSINRWSLNMSGTAESGSNSGSPLAISAYADNATLIDDILTCVRAAAGLMTIGGSTGRSVKFTGAIQDSAGIQRMSSAGVFSLTAGSTIDSQTLKKRSFACIYRTAAGVAQSIPTGSTYTKITAFDTNLTGNVGSTPDQANDRIVVDRTGVYQVDLTRSYSIATANVNWTVAIFVNGVVAAQTVQTVKSLSINTPEYTAIAVQVNANAGEAIDFRVYHDNGSSVDVTYHKINMSVTALD